MMMYSKYNRWANQQMIVAVPLHRVREKLKKAELAITVHIAMVFRLALYSLKFTNILAQHPRITNL